MSLFAFVKIFHFAGFLGCLLASMSKNVMLLQPAIEGRALSRLILLDKISGLSSVIILTTGIWMAGWVAKPTDYYLSSPLFWGKVMPRQLCSRPSRS